jgi:hypothetical protein
VFVRDYLGHSKLSTTDRYVSAKHRPEDFERLNRAFRSEHDLTVSAVEASRVGEEHNTSDVS